MHYTVITLDEMKQTLPGWTEVNGSTSCREYVYERSIPEDAGIVVRVFTSIHKDTAEGRRKGQDAIRICAVNIPLRLGWISTTRVLRVDWLAIKLGQGDRKGHQRGPSAIQPQPLLRPDASLTETNRKIETKHE